MRYAPIMAPDPASDLAEQHREKQSQVLQREGLEEELMQQDRSDDGERIEIDEEEG